MPDIPEAAVTAAVDAVIDRLTGTWFAPQAIRGLDLHPAFAAEARHLLGDCSTGERTDVAGQ